MYEPITALIYSVPTIIKQVSWKLFSYNKLELFKVSLFQYQYHWNINVIPKVQKVATFKVDHLPNFLKQTEKGIGTKTIKQDT